MLGQWDCIGWGPKRCRTCQFDCMNCCLGEARCVSKTMVNLPKILSSCACCCKSSVIGCVMLVLLLGSAMSDLGPSTMTTLNTSILGAFWSCDRCMTFGLALSWFAGTILQLTGGTSVTTLYGASQDDSRTSVHTRCSLQHSVTNFKLCNGGFLQ